MAKPKLINGKITCVNIPETDKLYLKRCGINLSDFVRQAIEQHKQGKFRYKYYDEDL